MNNVTEYARCSNCGACYNICPVDAISVNENGLFYDVQVNDSACTHCGLCKKVCPVNVLETRQQVQGAYGVIHNDEHILAASSSGGAFSAIAEYVLQNDGIVFGAVYSADCKSVEMASTLERPLDDLRRSKYVESKVGYTFRRVKKMLCDSPEKLVLYCGAPCQIAGLKRYLGKDYANLITCDFSCGGVPSHGMYGQYLSMIEKKLGSAICDVNFRPKSYGWEPHAIRIRGANGKVYQRLAAADPYFSCFVGANQHHSSVREYCMTCDFAHNHYADIILADFWKHQTASHMRNDNRGISLVVTNSLKGECILKAISEKVALTVLDIDEGTYNLKSKNFSTDIMQRRTTFVAKVEQEGFANAVRSMKLRSMIKFKIKYCIKKMLGRR